MPDMVGRVPDRLCLVRSALREESLVLTYAPVGASNGLYAPRLFQLIGDAGYVIEVTALSKQPGHVMVLRHQIGIVEAFGIFDSTPSPGQIQRIVDRDPTIAMVAQAKLKPEAGAAIQIFCRQFREGCEQSAGHSE
jgi:hypothetical protein